MRAPDVIQRALAMGHMTFEHGHLNLNLIGVRSSNPTPLHFDDRFHIVYKNQAGHWVEHIYPCTTDPGLHYLKKPMNVKGTAIMVPGQYRGAYRIGLHRKRYSALVQTGGDVSVYRDRNRDGALDMNGPIDIGRFGINIHHADSHRPSKSVGMWSAGCQVLSDPNDFKHLMKLARASAGLYGDRFTYTLLEEW